jgi:hypothetical protein
VWAAAEFVEIGPAKLTFIAPTHVKLRQDLAIHLFATSAASEMLSMELPSPFLSDPRALKLHIRIVCTRKIPKSGEASRVECERNNIQDLWGLRNRETSSSTGKHWLSMFDQDSRSISLIDPLNITTQEPQIATARQGCYWSIATPPVGRGSSHLAKRLDETADVSKPLRHASNFAIRVWLPWFSDSHETIWVSSVEPQPTSRRVYDPGRGPVVGTSNGETLARDWITDCVFKSVDGSFISSHLFQCFPIGILSFLTVLRGVLHSFDQSAKASSTVPDRLLQTFPLPFFCSVDLLFRKTYSFFHPANSGSAAAGHALFQYTDILSTNRGWSVGTFIYLGSKVATNSKGWIITG